MARTVLRLFAIAIGSLCFPALGQDAPPVSASPDHHSPTVERIDQGGAVRDAPLIGPPDPHKKPRNEIVVSAPCSANAEQGMLPGIYILDEKQSDNVMNALNSAIDAIPPSIYLPYFARRLRKAAAPAYAIKIRLAEGQFWIKNDAKRKIVVSTSGEAIEWTQEDGQVFDITAQISGEAISLTFRGIDHSERMTSYCSDRQQLVTETTITSPLLSTPIHYRVVYNRIADRVNEAEFVV